MIDENPHWDARIVDENEEESVLLGTVEKCLACERHEMISFPREYRYVVDDISFYFSELDVNECEMHLVEMFVSLVDIRSLLLETVDEISIVLVIRVLVN